ncbi:MAG: DNA polymerase III subunit delta [Magnetococcus sp. WYHC-3]
MEIKENELPARLKGPLPPVLLLFGPEQGRMERDRQTIRRMVLQVDGADAEFDEETFHGLDADDTRLISACRQAPFLAARRFVLLKGADRLDARRVATLQGYLERPGKTAVLLLTADEMEKRHPLRSAITAHPQAWAVAYYPPTGRDFHRWLGQSLQAHGLSADPDALDYLSRRLEGDTAMAAGEVEKLVLYMGNERQVHLEEAMDAVGETVEYNGGTLAAALTGGHTHQALQVLERLLEAGEAPLALLGSVARRVRQMIKARELLGQGHPEKTAATRVGVFWKEQDAFITDCRRSSDRWLRHTLLRLHEADRELKGGSVLRGLSTERLQGQLMTQLILDLAPPRGDPAPRSGAPQ